MEKLKIFRSIKMKARMGIALVLAVLGSFGFYLYYSGLEIQKYSSEMQENTYPSLVKARDLYNSIEKLKNKFAEAVMEEDEDVVAEALLLGEICVNKLEVIRETNSDPLLDTVLVDLNNYIQNVEIVVRQVIKGKDINFDIMSRAGELFHKLERFKDSEEANLETGFINIRYESRINFKTSIYIFTIIILTLFLFFSFILKFLAGLGSLSDQSEQIASGQFNEALKIDRNDELGNLQKNFEQMRLNVGDLIQNLDKKVKDRTSDISNIMDNIKIGLLTLDDKLIIHENYSEHAEIILGTKSLAGKYFPEFLYPEDKEKAGDVQLILNRLLEGGTSKDLLHDALPDTHIPWREIDPGMNGAGYISLNFDKIVDTATGKPSIMLSIFDVTQEIELQETLKKNREEYEENKALVKILVESGRESFSNFEKKHIDMLINVKKNLQPGKEYDKTVLNNLMRSFHTLKGDANVYSLTNISNLAHNVEYLLEETALEKNTLGDLEIEHLRGSVDELLREIRKMARKVNRVFGEEDTGRARGEKRKLSQAVPLEKIDGIIKIVKSEAESENFSSLKQVVTRLEELKKVPLQKLFTRFPNIVNDLAIRLGKEMYPVDIKGGDVAVTHDVLEKIGDCLIHMVRNSMDHGIESPVERIELGKAKKGLLQVHAHGNNGHIGIMIRDDGCGIDWAGIHAKAVEQKIVSWDKLSRLSKKDKEELLFQPGLTSREKNRLTELSGRGVGLDVVKSIIDGLGGTISIRSKLNEGTEFKMTIPS